MEILVTVVIPVYNQEVLLTKALDSIPDRPDIEVIIVDDASTDNSYTIACNYQNLVKNLQVTCLKNTENHGVAYTRNRAYSLARGKYILNLDSDDYLYTAEFNEVLPILINYNYDIVYFNLKQNDNTILKLTPETKSLWCGTVKFVLREFLSDLRHPEDVRFGEDWFLNQELLAKNPIEFYTDKILIHYNNPRLGSLCDLASKSQN